METGGPVGRCSPPKELSPLPSRTPSRSGQTADVSETPVASSHSSRAGSINDTTNYYKAAPTPLGFSPTNSSSLQTVK
ncbi:hypothetical protein D623_10014337 [Myotis brandtii]|uniref:Uncharacterized protein n=1 Tax=Myotis brandtii TaxID=109478 RepID=S7MQT1_MYOBR|nr:hypothetical protein D623_10014337 [Myotis brandtii]